MAWSKSIYPWITMRISTDGISLLPSRGGEMYGATTKRIWEQRKIYLSSGLHRDEELDVELLNFRARKEGVEKSNSLYDDIGCMATLAGNYTKRFADGV